MRPEFKAKLLQHLTHNDDNGFTLIELLVVIIIIGILAAIALPNFLNQDVKAKQAEAKQNIALINKSQSSYRTENSEFASSFDVLAIGSVKGGSTGATSNYRYTIASATETATAIASPTDLALKSYSGANTRFSNGANQSTIGTVLCETIIPGDPATPPTATAGVLPTCTPATQNTLSL
jgi:type IV pilus assembly protein PilA